MANKSIVQARFQWGNYEAAPQHYW